MSSALLASPQSDHPQKPDSSYIGKLVACGGPQVRDYPALDQWFTEAHQAILAAGSGAGSLRSSLMAAFGPAMSPATMQGHVWNTPLGYHGDFSIIDRIYLKKISSDPALAAWDHYFHRHAAPQAVRNRINYFKQVMDTRCSGRKDCLKVLLLGSGPAREAMEWLELNPDADVDILGLDIDRRAVAHAMHLNAAHRDRARFESIDVLRFQPAGNYDLIWAAGLFDYFSDLLFVKMLRRYIATLRGQGEMIVGNFCPSNPSRHYMEFGGWKLVHRDSTQLIGLALRASVSHMEVREEAIGVNLFLHLTP